MMGGRRPLEMAMVGLGWVHSPQTTDNVPALATLSITGSRGLAEGLPPTPACSAKLLWVFLKMGARPSLPSCLPIPRTQ